MALYGEQVLSLFGVARQTRGAGALDTLQTAYLCVERAHLVVDTADDGATHLGHIDGQRVIGTTVGHEGVTLEHLLVVLVDLLFDDR